MSKIKAVTYVFQESRFPLICSIDGYLVAIVNDLAALLSRSPSAASVK